MKKALSVLFAIVLVVAAMGFSQPKPTFAQTLYGISWASSIQVLNLGTSNADILLSFYNPDGTMAAMEAGYSNPQADTVLLGRSNTYYPLKVASGFSGSVVVSSSQPVAVVSNLVAMSTAPGLGSYVGFTQGSQKIYFPLLQKGNSDNYSFFSIQNTGTTEVTATIDLTPVAGSAFGNPPPFSTTIAVGAAKTFDMAALAEVTDAKWVGSASVAVGDPADSVAGVATTAKTSVASAYQISTYNAFNAGSTSVVLPLIQESNSGNRTSVNCQNIDPSKTTTVTVTYTPAAGIAPKTSNVIANVGPNALAVTLQQPSGTAKFVGSATVTSNPAVPLACVVNQQKSTLGLSSSYEGFDPTKATNTVTIPLVQSRNGSAAKGYVYTSINLATTDRLPHNIVCDFQPGPGFADPANSSASGVAAISFVQNDIYGTGALFVGGAVCTLTDTTSVGLIAVVNQTRSGTPEPIRDVLATYDGFAK